MLYLRATVLKLVLLQLLIIVLVRWLLNIVIPLILLLRIFIMLLKIKLMSEKRKKIWSTIINVLVSALTALATALGIG